MGAAVLGGYIKTLRNHLGISQEEAARRLEVSTKSVSEWERGTSVPEPLALRKIVRVLEASWDQIGVLLEQGGSAEEGSAAAQQWLAARGDPEAVRIILEAQSARNAETIAAELEDLARRIRRGE